MHRSTGCQKSTLLKKLTDKNDTIVYCFTNTACINLIADGLDENLVKTFDSAFYKNDDIHKGIKRILVDEYSMLPIKWIEQLYILKQRNITIILFGDKAQCEQVDIKYFDYMQKKVFRELVDYNLMNKQFVDGCSRYDKNLNNFLTHLKTTGQMLPLTINNNIDDELETNICKWNVTKDLNNDYFMMNRKYTKGLKLIGIANKKPIYNSAIYYIVDICPNDNKFSVS